MEEQIKKSIEGIRPLLQRDGGDIEFVAVEDGLVKVSLQGACGSCPMSQMTLKAVVEETLKNEVQGVKSVESI